MLKVDQLHVIRHKVLVEGLSVRRVAKEMGLSRNTVRKYLGESEPKRRTKGPRVQPVLAEVGPRLEQLMEEWSVRTTKKQRITGSRLHQELVSEGYQVGTSLVRGWLREYRRQRAEVYVPLVHRPGDGAQVDFFEVTVDLQGERIKVWKFLMRLMYSGHDFTWLYEHCDQLALLDGHVRAFEWFGGVPRRCIYDNLSAAVKRVLGSERALTDRFLALASHYVFEPCFTRVGEGHDKGGVESRGKGVRLQHLTPVPEGDSLRGMSEALQGRLEDRAKSTRNVDGKSVAELFAEEQRLLLRVPETAFEARLRVPVAVSSKALVRIDKAQYSVPTRWARLDAIAYVGVEDVRLECRSETLTCPRERRGKRAVRYRHYLPELARKPQAVRQVAEELLVELGEPYNKLWEMMVTSHGEREAARVLSRVLGALVDHGEELVSEAVREALGGPRPNLLVLRPLLSAREVPMVAVPASLAGHEVESASVELYDQLLRGGADE